MRTRTLPVLARVGFVEVIEGDLAIIRRAYLCLASASRQSGGRRGDCVVSEIGLEQFRALISKIEYIIENPAAGFALVSSESQ